MHSAHLFSLMACVCVQRMHIGVGCVCLCIQSHSSCCSPPVAERSLGSVVAPNSPSGLTGSQAQAEPSQPGWTCTELHLSCTAEVIHSNLTGAVRTAFIFPRLSPSLSVFFFSGWLADRCPSAPVFTATPAQLQAPQHSKNALLNETLCCKCTPSFSGCRDVNGV